MKQINKSQVDELVEEQKRQNKAGIWVDWFDTRVRIDKNSKRGVEMTFPSVYQAAEYVEKRMREAETVTGLVCVSDVTDLFEDKPFVYTEDSSKAVIMNLAKWNGQSSLAEVAMATWLHMHPAPE